MVSADLCAKSLPRDEKLERWGEGPWLDEPDWIEWREMGLQCLMRRTPLGTWCGYVGLPSWHPWHGCERGEIRAEIHGGVTFAAPADAGLWWVGFDCGHCFDVTPLLCKQLPGYMTGLADMVPDAFTPRYRDVSYVVREVNELARQCSEAGAERRCQIVAALCSLWAPRRLQP